MVSNNLTIIHADIDAFYAAVEQRDNPSLLGKPVVVGGEPHSRGVVATCSYEARQWGIKSAMPLSHAYRLCPRAVFLPVDMGRYRQASHQVFEILSSYTPLIEPISIDEAFLDVSGCLSRWGSPANAARDIKARVKQEVGLIISTGISYNKFLAKLATNLSKPNGMKVIRPEEALKVLSPLPVSHLWGVGSKTREILAGLGIATIGELGSTPIELLDKHLGTSGRLFWHLAHGLDTRKVEPMRAPKSIGKETTFPTDISDYSYLDKVLLEFAQNIGQRLRQAELQARTVNLKVRYYDFHTIARSRTMAKYTGADMDIYQVAVELLQHLNSTRNVRLIGVSVSNLQAVDSWRQGSLFESKTDSKQESLDKVLDQLNQRFGKKVITRASLLAKNKDTTI